MAGNEISTLGFDLFKWEPSFGVKPQRLTQAWDTCYKVDCKRALGVTLIILYNVREMIASVDVLVLIQTNCPPEMQNDTRHFTVLLHFQFTYLVFQNRFQRGGDSPERHSPALSCQGTSILTPLHEDIHRAISNNWSAN